MIQGFSLCFAKCIHSVYIYLKELFLLCKGVTIVVLNNLVCNNFLRSEMENQHFQHLLFFASHREQNCRSRSGHMQCVRIARKWFTKFKNGGYNFEDTPRSKPLQNSTSSVSRQFRKIMVINNISIQTKHDIS